MTGAPLAQDAMTPHPESDDPTVAHPSSASRETIERLESRLAEIEAERRSLAARLERLQSDFDRMETQLLSVLSSRAFRYSRGARRFWARISGG